MSTKSTILYDDDFHFYEEAFDTGYVYLQLRDRNCLTVDEDGVTVSIPAYVWEAINGTKCFDMSLADSTDQDILVFVTKEVTDRMKEYVSTGNKLIGFFGSFYYGSISDPIEKQIQAGTEHWIKVRDTQRLLRDQVLKIKQKNTSRP